MCFSKVHVSFVVVKSEKSPQVNGRKVQGKRKLSILSKNNLCYKNAFVIKSEQIEILSMKVINHQWFIIHTVYVWNNWQWVSFVVYSLSWADRILIKDRANKCYLQKESTSYVWKMSDEEFSHVFVSPFQGKKLIYSKVIILI